MDAGRNDTQRRGGAAARIAVGLAGTWILAGALFKLLSGTPNDLPEVVKNIHADVDLTYKLAIGVELALAVLALFRPRWAWFLLSGALLTFIGILLTMLGADSCGCLGSSVTIPPWLMLTIDAVFLTGILVTRPWRSLSTKGLPAVLVAFLVVIGITLPWLHDRSLPEGVDLATLTTDGETATVPDNAYVILDVEEWVGKDIAETPLGELIDDVYALPSDGLWILYRQDCEHCAEHLEHLAANEYGDRFITLVKLQQEHDNEGNRVVHVKPQGEFVTEVELPDSVQYVLTTPGELELEAWQVVRAEEGVETH